MGKTSTVKSEEAEFTLFSTDTGKLQWVLCWSSIFYFLVSILIMCFLDLITIKTSPRSRGTLYFLFPFSLPFHMNTLQRITLIHCLISCFSLSFQHSNWTSAPLLWHWILLERWQFLCNQQYLTHEQLLTSGLIFFKSWLMYISHSPLPSFTLQFWMLNVIPMLFLFFFIFPKWSHLIP